MGKEALTQAIGRLAREAGFCGLKAPSNAVKGRNLEGSYNAVFFIKLKETGEYNPADSVELHGPPGSFVIVESALAAALDHLTTSDCAASVAPNKLAQSAPDLGRTPGGAKSFAQLPLERAPLDFSATVRTKISGRRAAPLPHPRYADVLSRVRLLPRKQASAQMNGFRFQSIEFLAMDAVLAGAHAEAVGGRFNPRGTPAIYLALSDAMALKEFTATFEAERTPPPAALIALQLPANAANAALITICSLSAAELAAMTTALPGARGDTETIAQAIGRAASESGCALLEAPSKLIVASRGETIWVAFPRAAGFSAALGEPTKYAAMFGKHCPDARLPSPQEWLTEVLDVEMP